MQLKYLKDRISMELDSSYEYVKKLMDVIKENPKWSNILRVISDDKYEHAEQLYKIFMELYMNSKHQDTYVNSIRDSMIETFNSKTRMIDDYRATFDFIIGSPEPQKEEEKENERDTAD